MHILSGIEISPQSGEQKKLQKARITLNDCLACSGCITSAESVLITQQSQEELYNVFQENFRLQQVAQLLYKS